MPGWACVVYTLTVLPLPGLPQAPVKEEVVNVTVRSRCFALLFAKGAPSKMTFGVGMCSSRILPTGGDSSVQRKGGSVGSMPTVSALLFYGLSYSAWP